MNLNSREIRKLNIKSFFNLWRCCRCCFNCFLQLGQRASACTFDHLFGCLACVCSGFSYHFPCVHSVVFFFCAGGIRLLFEMVFKHTESRSSFSCNQNVKEEIPTALEVFHESIQATVNTTEMKLKGLYSPRNDPDPEMIPNPEMIPKSTLK